MSCQNCKSFQHLCKSECCSLVPIDKALWEKNQDKVQQKPSEILEMGHNVIVPITPNMKCPFLSPDLSCAIYDDRPEVCKLFGNESHINLTCAYQRANGDARSFL